MAGGWFAIALGRTSWDVSGVTGAPAVDGRAISGRARLGRGEWLVTDGASRARVAVGRIGSVDVEPNTRIQLVAAGGREHRLALERGHDSRPHLGAAEVLLRQYQGGGRGGSRLRLHAARGRARAGTAAGHARVGRLRARRPRHLRPRRCGLRDSRRQGTWHAALRRRLLRLRRGADAAGLRPARRAGTIGGARFRARERPPPRRHDAVAPPHARYAPTSARASTTVSPRWRRRRRASRATRC